MKQGGMSIPFPVSCLLYLPYTIFDSRFGSVHTYRWRFEQGFIFQKKSPCNVVGANLVEKRKGG